MNELYSRMSESAENNKTVHTSVIRIPVNEIEEYALPNTVVDEDVVSRNGAVLIPRGTKLSTISKSASVKNSLQLSKIESIAILITKQLEDIDLVSATNQSDFNFAKVDPKLAKDTINQVTEVYSRISNGNCESKDISGLIDRGRSLAETVTQAPEIMFCLGHVRGSDEYTSVHSLNVALICGFIANKLFPNNEEMVQRLAIGGILHDLGKAKIPNEILNKPGQLTVAEFDVMKMHPIFGEEIARSFGIHDQRVLSVIRNHHEKFSGNGYPDVLPKEKISIEAKIAAVADVFDALTAKRVYKEPMGCRNAVLVMIEKMNMSFDPAVLRTLVLSIGLYPPGITVELTDGSIGIVVRNSEKDLVRPEVMISVDKYGRKVEDVQILDLSKSNELIFIKQVLKDHDKIVTY
jgi:putative nucleotidyltransferase with HDIG domain